jgi:isopenicillin-N N-acyltransferase-like protein
VNRPIRLLRLEGAPASRGRAHGEAHGEEIRAYAAERVRLASNGSWAGRPATTADVLDLAQQMLPAHRAYAPDLFEEMEAMAAAAGLTPAEAVVVGGFTDFVDAVRALGGTVDAEEDDCTAVLVPDGLAEGAGFLAQTWDMHDSATEHVVLLDVRPEGAPAALIYSTVGCLAQIGMNEAGICLGINNLTADEGRAGVTWPFVVRKALQQSSLDAALACVLEAELAGAHNYLLLDRTGSGFNVEAMPSYHRVDRLEGEPLVHTNHCLHPETREREAPRPADLLASSVARLARASEILRERPITVDLLIGMTREPEAICRRSEPPHHVESSGAAIMRPQTREMWACWGVPADNEFERFVVDGRG